MYDIGVFSDWVAAGAAFGVKAFFAIFVFAFICAACIGVLSLLTYALKGGESDGEKKHRPY